MNDLTVVFLTVNKVPKEWAKYHMSLLKEAIGKCPVITVSRIPMDFGTNILQTPPFNSSNIYWQMLRAFKMAETKYVAVVEDDAIYPKEHFEFRPKDDEFGYNMSRWAILTWGKPTYFHRDRISNLTLIAPRELAIKCLEERFEKYPNGTPEDRTGELGKERVEKRLGLPSYKIRKFYTKDPIVNFNHIYSIDQYEQQQKKSLSRALLVYDIPKWGKAEELVKRFK